MKLPGYKNISIAAQPSDISYLCILDDRCSFRLIVEKPIAQARPSNGLCYMLVKSDDITKIGLSREVSTCSEDELREPRLMPANHC